ncbi:MAG: molybdopterin biosynthesis protein [Caldilinea sp. CFX5]|nr:molybdopterin biosynthesis protein [Caldilinea sp. CFX5]
MQQIHTQEQSIYLHDIALDQAVTAWHTALSGQGLLQPLPSEVIPLPHALGRVTAAPVWARISAPHYHASAMDGYAVLADDTRGATETSPKQLRIGQQAFYVDTGDPLPPQTNAVIMIEHVQRLESADGPCIEILEPTPPWRYVRPMGEDMVATELVLPANHRLRPQDLGAIAGCGHNTVAVYRRPRVAIIPTGTELVSPGIDLKPGDIIEYNSLMLGAQAEEAGAVVTRYPITADVYDAIRAAVVDALATHDLVAVNAGSSAGSEDYTARIVADLGQLCVHGIAIRPGHPVILGVAQGKALVGIPGYPVSAALTFDLLVKPLLYRWQGQLPPERPTIQAQVTRKVLSPMGEDEFLRVTVGKVGDKVVTTPLAGGAGVISSLVKADGILTIPRFSEGHHAGEQVTVELLCAPSKIDKTIVAIGSHDMTLDLLADYLRRAQPQVGLSSAHVGSLSGLLALQRGEAHLAGSHLLDEETGEYNLGYIQRLLTPHGVRVVVLGFVNRVQGLIVPKGNPKGVTMLDDLLRPDVVFVNRQRGAGTRVLLDYELKRRQLNPRQIQGYERQEYTHLAVAAAVKSGAADCGLGIMAAARALDLAFVPLLTERYDLIIPVEHYASDLLQPLLGLIRADSAQAFRQAVAALGGYETEQMGQVLAEV